MPSRTAITQEVEAVRDTTTKAVNATVAGMQQTKSVLGEILERMMKALEREAEPKGERR